MAIDESMVPELLQPLWKERAPRVLERIERVVQVLRQEPGTSREEGLAEAHKLHGLLGTFGFHEGSQLAGVAEELLESDVVQNEVWNDAADQLAALHLALATLTAPGLDDNDRESEQRRDH